jgi:hypothetical protein
VELLGVKHAAMVATSEKWKRVGHVLEGQFRILPANAAHAKNASGRKTDLNGAMWLADLLAPGLSCASFVPPAAVQDPMKHVLLAPARALSR